MHCKINFNELIVLCLYILYTKLFSWKKQISTLICKLCTAMNVIDVCPLKRHVLRKSQKLDGSTDAIYSDADPDATWSELCPCDVGSSWSDIVSQTLCVNERCKSTSLLISLFC